MAKTNLKRSDAQTEGQRQVRDALLAKAAEKIVEYVRARSMGGKAVPIRKIIQSKVLTSKTAPKKTAPADVYRAVIESVIGKELKWEDEQCLALLPAAQASSTDDSTILEALADGATPEDDPRDRLKKMGKAHFERRSYIAWAVAVHRRDAEKGLTAQAAATLETLKTMLAKTEESIAKYTEADDEPELQKSYAIAEKADLEHALAACASHALNAKVHDLRPTAPEMRNLLPRERECFPQQRDATVYSGLGSDLNASEREKEDRKSKATKRSKEAWRK